MDLRMEEKLGFKSVWQLNWLKLELKSVKAKLYTIKALKLQKAIHWGWRVWK